MISVCTVVDKLQQDYFGAFLNSLLAMNSGLITDVYVAKIDDTATGRADWTEIHHGVRINYFDVHVPKRTHWISYKHSIGLHKCMDRVLTPYIMLTDCDLLFLCPRFDEFYVRLMDDNKLTIAGIEMYKIAAWPGYATASPCAYGSFPSLHNCMVRTGELPKPDMFAGKLYYTYASLANNNHRDTPIPENYYLVCGCVWEYRHLYPHPHGVFDTGSNLLIWNHLRGGDWLSFRPGWRTVQTNAFVASKPINIPPHQSRDLLYHQGGIFDGFDTSAFWDLAKQRGWA